MDKDWANTIKDDYSNDERGLERLKDATRNHKSLYQEYSNFEYQLKRIINDGRANYDVQDERKRVIGRLNFFCIKITKEEHSFNDICDKDDIIITLIASDPDINSKQSNKIQFQYLEKIIESYEKELSDELYKPLLGVQSDIVTDSQENLGPQLSDIKVIQYELHKQGSKTDRRGDPTFYVSQLWQENSKIVLVGDAGVGKTTTLKRLAVHVAQQNLGQDDFNWIPIWVSLMDVTGDEDLRELIREALDPFGRNLKRRKLDGFIEGKKCLFLFDGLNEMSPEVYQRCFRSVNKLAKKHSHCRFIISDRPNYDGVFEGFTVFKLDKWDAETTSSYVSQALKLLGNKRSPETLLHRIKNDQSLYSIVNNPLQLGLLTNVYSENGEIAPLQTDLFKQFIQILLERDAKQAFDDPVKKHIKHQLLTDLAFHAAEEEKSPIPDEFVHEQLARTLAALPQSYDSEAALESLLRNNWLQKVPSGNFSDDYRFNLKIFQKLFAAYYLADAWEQGESLDAYIANPEWEQSIMHVAGLLDDQAANEFTSKVLDLGDLELAVRCGVNLKPDSAIRRELVARLENLLSSPNEAERIEASRLLIWLHDSEAQETLIRAIINDTGKVQWNAALALQRVMDTQYTLEHPNPSEIYALPSDEKFIEILETNIYSDDAHIAACIALGRSKSHKAIDALLRVLDSTTHKVRNSAAVSLAKASDDNIINLLINVIRRDRNHNAMAGALRALQIARPDKAKLLAQEMRHYLHTGIKYQVDLILGQYGDEEVINRYIQGVQTTTGKEQWNNLLYLAAVKSPLAIDPLWELIADSQKQDILASIISASGGAKLIQRAATDLKNSEAKVRKAAVKILGKIKNDEEILPYLIEALQDKNPSVRDTARNVLIEFGEPAMPELRTLFEDSLEGDDLGLMSILILTLAGIGTRTAIQLLVDALSSSNEKVLILIDRSLERTNQERARIILRESFRDPTQQNLHVSRILETLEKKYHEELFVEYQITIKDSPQNAEYVMERIEREAKSDIEIIRLSAKNLLQRIERLDEPGAVERIVDLKSYVNALKQQLNNPDPRRRKRVAEQLGTIGQESSLGALLSLCQKRNEVLPVRQTAIDQLQHFAGEQVVDTLTKLLRAPEREIHSAALETLYLVGGKKADQALLNIFERTRSSSSRERTYQVLQTRSQKEPSSTVFARMVRLSVSRNDKLQPLAFKFLNKLNAKSLPADYKNILVMELTDSEWSIQKELNRRFITFVRKEYRAASGSHKESIIKEIASLIGKDRFLDQTIETLLHETYPNLVQIVLIDNLSSERVEVIKGTLKLFNKFPLKAIPDQFSTLINHKNLGISIKTAHVLSHSTDDSAIPLLIKCLEHPHPKVQQCGVDGLIQHSSAQITTQLIHFAKRTEHQRFRHQIIAALSGSDQSDVIAFLIESLNHDDMTTKQLAAQVLANSNSSTVQSSSRQNRRKHMSTKQGAK